MTKHLRYLCALLLLAVASVGWAEESVTYTFQSKSWTAVLGNSTTFANWTSGKDGAGWASSQGVQVTTAASGANATSPISYSNISKIVVVYNTNKSSGKGIIKIQVGENAEKSNNVAYSGSGDGRSSNYTTEFDNINQSGSVKLTVTCSTNSIYVHQIIITYGASAPTVAAPTFRPADGTTFGDEGLEVSISQADNKAIYYTLDGSDPDNTSTQYTAPFTINATTTVKAIAYDGTDASTIATATYTYVDPNAPGTQNNPYTVDQARKAIDAGSGTEGVYATGIVSAIPTAWSSEHNNITFNFVDNSGDEVFLQAYRCVSTDNADASTVAVGDIVVVYGNLAKHNTTYEFAQGCQLISLTRPVVAVEKPTFSVASGIFDETQTVSISCATSNAVIYYTTDGTEPTNASTPYEVPLTISSNTILKAVAYVGTASSYVESATYCFPETKTVTEALAIINSMENGATSDWEYYVSGIVSTASTSLSSGTLTYSISADGQTTNELTVYRGKGLNNEAFEAATDIQVNDIVTVCGKLQKYVKNSVVTPEIASGNFLKSFERPATPIETKVNVGTHTHVTAVEMWYVDADIVDIEDGDEVAEGTEVFVLPTAETGYTVESVTVVDASNNSVTVTENTGNWSFIMPNSSVTINIAATQSSVTPDDKTLTNANIVEAGSGGTGYGEWSITDSNGKVWNAYAIKNQHSNATSAYHFLQIKKYGSNTAYYIQVPEYGTKITSLEMTVSGSSKPMDGGGNTATLFFSAENSTAADGDGVASGTGESTVTIDCSGLNLNTGYITASGAVRIWDVKVTYEEATTETVEVKISPAGLATFCSDKALDFTNSTTVYAYKAVISGSQVNLTKVAKVPAQTGVLLRSVSGGEVEANIPVTTGVEAFTDNAFVAVMTEIASLATETTEDGVTYVNYILNKVNGVTDFYKANGKKVGANKAYLRVEANKAKDGLTIGYADETDGIRTIGNEPQKVDGIYNLSGQRVNKAQKGIYIVNGKKVVIR